ncbi:competence protein ComK [Fictibacillus iocasae]|uniref:Competence protein ComK n=1 Tax=Fictibacillus iocasae TaxID=2715437 RepID=A0ABW2NM19_9BACL
MEELQFVSEYEISKATIMILPYLNKYGFLYSEVRELGRTVFVEMSPMAIIKDNCLHYGSTYQGRIDAVRQQIGNRSLTPVLISEIYGLCFFPLESPSSIHCIWVSQPHVKAVKAINTKKSTMIFRNKTSIIVPQSRPALLSKIQKTAQIRCELMLRFKELEIDLSWRTF